MKFKKEDEVLFGYIGRLVKQKNVGLIINSFNNLKKNKQKNKTINCR